MLAAARRGSGEVVKLLLDHGAKLEGQPVLARAASAGDEAVMRMLIDRGVDRKPLPQDLAVRSGCPACVDLLLQSAEQDDLNRALVAAARNGDSKTIEMLLARGATANGAALRLASASEKIPLAGVQALLEKGARDDAALPIAKRQGDTPVVAALKSAGLKDPAALDKDAPDQHPPPPAAARSVRAAVEKSLPLLQHADVVFLRKAGCVSCHSNSLTEMTIALARKNGFSVDERTAQSQLNTIRAYLESWRERVLQDIPIPGGVDTVGYILAGLAASNYPPDPATDALARYLRRRQAAGRRMADCHPASAHRIERHRSSRHRSARAAGVRTPATAGGLRAGRPEGSNLAQAGTTEDHGRSRVSIAGSGVGGPERKDYSQSRAGTDDAAKAGWRLGSASDAFERRLCYRAGADGTGTGWRIVGDRPGLSKGSPVLAEHAVRRWIVAGGDTHVSRAALLRQRIPSRARSIHLGGSNQLGHHGAGARGEKSRGHRRNKNQHLAIAKCHEKSSWDSESASTAILRGETAPSIFWAWTKKVKR